MIVLGCVVKLPAEVVTWHKICWAAEEEFRWPLKETRNDPAVGMVVVRISVRAGLIPTVLADAT